MIFINAFLVGGLICVIGQILLDNTKLLPVHITAIFVAVGTLLDTFNIYDKIVNFAGAGASVPITSFGHSLSHGAYEGAVENGLIGLGAGMFDLTASGITSAILFSFIFAILLKPRG